MSHIAVKALAVGTFILTIGWMLKTGSKEHSVSLHKRAELLWARPLQQNRAPMSDFINGEIEENLNRLPLKGKATKVPGPGWYWPSYKDSINAKVNNERSPGYKYEKIFKSEGFMAQISTAHGKRYFDYLPIVTPQNCKKNEIFLRQRCIPKWAGSCGGRTIASTLYDRPQYSVNVGNISVYPRDLTAWQAIIYDGAEVPYFGEDCFLSNEEASQIRLNRDLGSPCMGINAATLHLLLTNVIGIEKENLAMNLNANTEIWNYPVHSYETEIIRIMTPEEAYQAYPERMKFAEGTVEVVEYSTTIIAIGMTTDAGGYLTDEEILDPEREFIVKKKYTYLLEKDQWGYGLGGEYTGISVHDHPGKAWAAHKAVVKEEWKKQMKANIDDKLANIMVYGMETTAVPEVAQGF